MLWLIPILYTWYIVINQYCYAMNRVLTLLFIYICTQLRHYLLTTVYGMITQENDLYVLIKCISLSVKFSPIYITTLSSGFPCFHFVFYKLLMTWFVWHLKINFKFTQVVNCK